LEIFLSLLELLADVNLFLLVLKDLRLLLAGPVPLLFKLQTELLHLQIPHLKFLLLRIVLLLKHLMLLLQVTFLVVQHHDLAFILADFLPSCLLLA
jgi:hypothetical protein